jgi:hypothetical protein
MKEQEFINAQALGTLRAAIDTLKVLVPENLPGTIKRGDTTKVFKTLYEWQDRLNDQIEIQLDIPEKV